MKRRQILGAVLAMVLISGLAVQWKESHQNPKPGVRPSPLKLRSFLESQYVPEANLLRAAVKAHPDNKTI
ncbi:hypothetical protein [Thermococcus sp.]|uniref:hypothetical protein n=1 Tax=Thermococcus sp. TaxID=35749 RepID=UPI0025E7080D|nr:hypothetical protein [Thermococcus sp.]